MCSECGHFSERGTSVLVIKLDALGDVLRTTAVLPALHRAYDPCYVTWITSRGAMDLFIGNEMVDEVLDEAGAVPMLAAREFDLVINPDASLRSCALASMARGKRKQGFLMSSEGYVEPMGKVAEDWLRLGSFDQLKRENRKTYQQILHDMCELDSMGQHIVLSLTESESSNAATMKQLLESGSPGPIVGVNVGAGARWKHKKWRVEGFIEMISMLLEETNASVMLLGGTAERERSARIRSHFDARVADACQENLRDFIREVGLCDVVVTGDTLALHVALGLNKRVVALFGPTSPWEVDVYDQGQKIVPTLDCVCCYKPDCDSKPTCMDMIDARDVFRAVTEELSRVPREVMIEA
jgi:heptosyltransferase-2